MKKSQLQIEAEKLRDSLIAAREWVKSWSEICHENCEGLGLKAVSDIDKVIEDYNNFINKSK